MPKRLFPVLRFFFAVSSARPADQTPTNVFSGKTWMKVAPEQSGWSVHADTLAGQGDPEKLLVLEVSFGDHQRAVLAGMKWERASPREIEGKQALFVGNLPPRKMAGMVSEGTLFDISYSDGITPVLATPETRVPDGSRAR